MFGLILLAFALPEVIKHHPFISGSIRRWPSLMRMEPAAPAGWYLVAT
jgi:hypothetical protein